MEIDDIIEEIFELGKDDAEKALRILLDYGQCDGSHHKTWAIDQAVRALAGNYYEKLIESYKCGDEHEGPDTYVWETGMPP